MTQGCATWGYYTFCGLRLVHRVNLLFDTNQYLSDTLNLTVDLILQVNSHCAAYKTLSNHESCEFPRDNDLRKLRHSSEARVT